MQCEVYLSANSYAKLKEHLHFSGQQICSSLLACIVQTHLVQLLKSVVKCKRINSYQSIIIIIIYKRFVQTMLIHLVTGYYSKQLPASNFN